MNKVEPRTLPGFMELLPEEQILFNQIKEKIEKTYQKFGFLPLDTPIIESSEVLQKQEEKLRNKYILLKREIQIYL